MGGSELRNTNTQRQACSQHKHTPVRGVEDSRDVSVEPAQASIVELSIGSAPEAKVGVELELDITGSVGEAKVEGTQ